MRNRIGLLCLTVLLVCVLPMTVFAQNFDAARKGSISVTLTEGSEKKPVAGAELSEEDKDLVMKASMLIAMKKCPRANSLLLPFSSLPVRYLP